MYKSGDSILRGAREALAHARGDKTRGRTTFVRVPAPIDVKVLRRQLGLSQEAFADRYGINVVTVQDWEQGRRRPSGAARVLLTVIATSPRRSSGRWRLTRAYPTSRWTVGSQRPDCLRGRKRADVVGDRSAEVHIKVQRGIWCGRVQRFRGKTAPWAALDRSRRIKEDIS